MEIDVTDFYANNDWADFSASRAELGNDAGKITWGNAVASAADTRWVTDETRDEFESWVKEFGAWDDEDIKGWSLDECNALLIQYISGDMREIEALCMGDDGEINWDKVEALSNEGTIGGRMYSVDGRIYFYMGI